MSDTISGKKNPDTYFKIQIYIYNIYTHYCSKAWDQYDFFKEIIGVGDIPVV